MSVAEPSVVWDLSDLYSGLEDPAIQADQERSLEDARAFEERHRGRIADAGCTVETLRAALDEYEQLSRRQVRPMAYASLLFSADTTDPARGALMQQTQVANTAVARHLIFFDLEPGRMPEATYRGLIDDPRLSEYRHYLEHERVAARHHLTEPEEKISEELANTGIRAWNRLFSELTSRVSFRLKIGDEVKEMTQSEATALLYDGDRELRKAAGAAITQAMQELSHPITFIYNNLLQHKSTVDRLRSYDYPEQARHEANELEPEVVQTLVDCCVEGYDLVADYYKLKQRLLGLEELTHIDRYAPISASNAEIEFADARRMVLQAFGDFSTRVREEIEPFFERSWIDADLRAGKRGGAFCAYISPDLHPYVFLNYTKRARDVMTLAHELGHGLHGMLAAHNNFLSFYPSLPLAETASVFAEMLTFERLQREIDDPRERLGLLTEKIEDSIATVFRQATMYRFEQAAHRARREQGELTTERFNALWQTTMQEMFGDALILGEEHAWWWHYIPHIFSTPFYVYAYAFGELLVLALYARYRQEGEGFVGRYLDLLSAGGSRKPHELLAEIGIDIRERAFWQGGVQLIRDMVERAKGIAQQIEG